MSGLDATAEKLLALHEQLPGDASPALAAFRAAGREQFAAQGLPHRKLEEWRYTNLAALANESFALPERGSISRDEIEALASPVFACSLHVFVDGRYDASLSALGAAAEVHVEYLSTLSADAKAELAGALGTRVDGKEHPFAALNAALLEDAALIRVPKGVHAEEPLHLVFVSTGAGRIRSPRILVVAEADSSLRIIQDHVATDGASGITNAVTEVAVGANARVECIALQRENDATWHFSNTSAHVERDGRFANHVLTLGGKLVRNDLAVSLAGEGADGVLNGLFVGAGPRVVDNHTLVDHAVPHCTSAELYKGVLGDDSRGVFRGRVLVRPDAQKTNATQSNPNLLLSRRAEIDTKPQLEIYADDVKCSHGSAIGQLQDEALFYLQTRGIDEAAAREILTRGFAREILDALPIEALREGLDDAVMASLADAAEDDA